MLHTLPIAKDHLFVNGLFNLLELWIRIFVCRFCPVLDVEHDFISTVDAHRKTAGLQWIQILVIAQISENTRRLASALLLDPRSEPIKEASLRQLIIVIARKLAQDVEFEEVHRDRFVTSLSEELVDVLVVE